MKSTVKISGAQLGTLIGWQNKLRDKDIQTKVAKYSQMAARLDDGNPLKRAYGELISTGADIPDSHPILRALSEGGDGVGNVDSKEIKESVKKLVTSLEEFGIIEREVRGIPNKRTRARMQRLLSMAHLLMREVNKVQNEEFGDK